LQIEVMEIRQVNRKLSAEVHSLRKGKTGLRAEVSLDFRPSCLEETR
jgi:hypothetical protein